MGNCQALLTWPEEILKILHAVFTALGVICAVLKSAPPDKGYFHTLHVHFMVLLVLPLLVACAVLLVFIFDDPRKWKSILLIYYVMACAACTSAFCTGVEVWDDIRELPAGHPSGDDAYYYLGIWLCSFCGAICYGASCYLNGAEGKA